MNMVQKFIDPCSFQWHRYNQHSNERYDQMVRPKVQIPCVGGDYSYLQTSNVKLAKCRIVCEKNKKRPHWYFSMSRFPPYNFNYPQSNFFINVNHTS